MSCSFNHKRDTTQSISAPLLFGYLFDKCMQYNTNVNVVNVSEVSNDAIIGCLTPILGVYQP